jgi:hypothetical protein
VVNAVNAPVVGAEFHWVFLMHLILRKTLGCCVPKVLIAEGRKVQQCIMDDVFVVISVKLISSKECRSVNQPNQIMFEQ